jgi:raffinose/stachyose/melibiose transport system permease protein
METSPVGQDHVSVAPIREKAIGLRKRRSLSFGGLIYFVLPALFFYLFVVIVPSIRGSVYAFTDWDGLAQDFKFVGFSNFIGAFNTKQSHHAIVVTLIIAVAVTVLQNFVGLLLALGVNSRIKSRNFLRVLFFTPVVMSPVVVAYVWQFLLSPNGPVNSIVSFLSAGNLRPSWLGDPNLALASIIIVIIWQFAGFSMVIFLAGLQRIPDEVLEAAQVDGATPFRILRYITFPLLAPALTINLMLSMIGGLKVFDQAWVLTGGGPSGKTDTVSTIIFRNAFQYGEFGSSIALALILTVAIALISIIQYRPLLKREFKS